MSMPSPRLLETTLTYLEMRARPQRESGPPAQHVSVLQAVRPTVSFYRYLYNTVGQEWLWYQRRQLSDEQLRAIIQHPEVEIHVLYVEGVPAGYGELNLQHMPEIELAYFGLIPEFIGKGLGTFFLNAVIDKAWAHHPQRLWLHTCTLDHPQALAVYQRAGFVPYKQEARIFTDPRDLGVM
ncbi:GNAT family N-acetyltransferase [candidate division KSB1 bacterium]|nr:GNAT family N-acetyltransferase [candidate division KSB1 bacterium]